MGVQAPGQHATSGVPQGGVTGSFQGRSKTRWRDYSSRTVRIMIPCCHGRGKISRSLRVLLPPLPDFRLVEDDRRMKNNS